jgi:C1A family cysteine protease
MKQWIAWFSFVVIGITMIGSLSGAGAQEIVQAPDNPAYMEFVNVVKAKHAHARFLGRIPAPVDMTHLKGRGVELSLAAALPSAYDSREHNRVSPIRDQGINGTCWAHAALGALECRLLPGETYSFSPNHMVNLAGFNNGYDDGGNMYMAVAYLVRWTGPVWESEDPYPAPSKSPPGLVARKHIQNVVILPPRTSATDNNHIKNAITQYGALDIDAMYADDPEHWDPKKSAMYYDGTGKAGHSLNVIGWDDNFSAANFVHTPPGNGAFLMKDSSGTAFGGMGGFYYISYYDTVIGYDEILAFHDAETATNFGDVYQYDPYGLVGRWGYDSMVAYAANMFNPATSASLKAVGFYAVDLNMSYDIDIYAGCSTNDPRSGTLYTSQSGVLTNAGFHTIRLTSPVNITAAERFSVVIRLAASSVTNPIPVEYAKEGYTSRATAAPGQSYLSADGKAWTDATTKDSTANVCLKAYLGGASPTNPIIGSNSIDVMDVVKITDMSGLLPDSGGAVAVMAWDKDGKQLTTAGYALPLSIINHGTTSILGEDLKNRFPDGAPAAYIFSVESSKMFITNVNNSIDGAVKVPIIYSNGLSNFVSNSIGARNTIKVTDMSGAIPVGGIAITVTAWDASGKIIPESTSAASLKLYSHGTTTIDGSSLPARFPTGIPITYEFTIDSPKLVISNVKNSSDGTLNIPTVYTVGVSNFVANSIGSRNTIYISDFSGTLGIDGAAINVRAWDVSGTEIPDSGSLGSYAISNYETVKITGTALASRFSSGSPMTYEFTVNSSKVVITNVKSSSDGSINIPTVYTSGINNYSTNYVSDLNTIQISDMSSSIPAGGASITIRARDGAGNLIPESGSAIALKLINNATITIEGNDLKNRFTGVPVTYEFSIDSSTMVITNLTKSTDGTINIPTVFTIGPYGGI